MDENKKKKKETGDDMWSSAEEDMKERAPPDLLKKEDPELYKKEYGDTKVNPKDSGGKKLESKKK
ncbi:hypothetical protein Metbo_1777 [Methanobacterium lacus]|uniref:Uncharacterized protein n=1 Tax=Methanobacterium lacus (strain AL-21) TaxID=877455 RepID=F0TA50_METLA|nr:hypothetical protein [Methanobacterium lacus]ADZ10000.1 hypothetical protein Metbo_1777 [Methanobacterium lacus]